MSRRGGVLFATLSVLWGIPYLFIKVAVSHLDPTVVVFGRTALGALILLPPAAVRGQLRPLVARRGWILLFAVVEIAGPFGLLGYAERRLSSSFTALLIAAVPLVGAVLAGVLRLEDRVDRRRMAGLVLGLAGVGALLGIDRGSGDPGAVAAVGLVVLGYAAGPVIVATRLSDVPGPAVSAVALALNAIGYALAAARRWPARPGAVPASAWWSVIVLGVACTAAAFIVFFALVAEVGPARATVITYVNPAVAVVLGVVVLGEPLTAGMLIGFPLVLLGSWLATWRRPGPR